MIEIKGWVNIDISFDGEHKTSDLVETISKIEEYITKEKNVSNQFLEIRNLNGSYLLFIGIYHNHNIGYTDLVYDILNTIGALAKGSHGLVYIRNHDDSEEYNTYQVLNLIRGKVSTTKDRFFSPCRPTIED